MSREVEELFFDGVYLESEGYLQPSIDSQIERIVAASLNVATILQNNDAYASEAEAIIEARRDLLNATSIKEKNRALLILDNSLKVLAIAIDQNSDLSGREHEALAQHLQRYEGAYTFILVSLAPSYNSKVDEYYDQRSFIAALFSGIAPERFA